MPPGHWLLLLLANLLFGFNLTASKFGMLHMPPLLFTGLRFVLLSLVLWPLLRVPRDQLPTVIAIALCMGGVHFGFMYVGLAFADDISTVAIAAQLAVPFAALLGVMALGERIGWRRVTGMLLAFGGVAWLGFDPRVLGYLPALGLVVVGALGAAVGITLMKRLRGVSPLALQAWVGVVGAPALLAMSWWLESGQVHALVNAPALVWGAIAFSALGASLVAHGSLYWLLQRHDVSFISPLTLLTTVFAAGFGVWLMGDVLTSRMLLSGGVTLAGVAIIAVRSGATTGKT